MTKPTVPDRPRVPLTDDQLQELIAFGCVLADRAGQVIRPHFRRPIAVDDKAAGAAFDPVTVADRDAETAIRSLVHESYPDHGMLGEEHGFEKGTSGLTWIIDPIDGTRAFIVGFPIWTTLIALHDGEGPVLGIVDQPHIGERFVGSRLGAELRSRSETTPMRTRACGAIEAAIMAATDPLMFAPGAEREAFDRITARTRLTRYGGDGYAYAMVAAGMLDLVVEASLGPWDIQAHMPILKAAGGIATAWDGGPAQHGGRVVVAGDARIHAQALAILAGA